MVILGQPPAAWGLPFLAASLPILLALGSACSSAPKVDPVAEAVAAAEAPGIRELLPRADAPGKSIEIYWRVPSTGKGPWPTLVLIHGHQEGARPGAKVYADVGRLALLAERHGMIAVAVSQPGYGGSDGPADYGGPGSQAAVREVVRWLRAQPIVDPSRVGLYGVSRGAIVASMVAIRDSALAAVVLDAGVYELGASLADLRKRERSNDRIRGIADRIASETGGASPEALRARSALPSAKLIRSPLLILHGAKDDRAPANQARELGRRVAASGTRVETVIFPEYGHFIPFRERDRLLFPFLERAFGDNP